MDDNGHDGSADSGRTGDGGPHPGFPHPHPKGWTGPLSYIPFLSRCLRVFGRLRRTRGWPVPVSRPESFAVEGERFVVRWPLPGFPPVAAEAMDRGASPARAWMAAQAMANRRPDVAEQVLAAQRGVESPSEAVRHRNNSRGYDVNQRYLMCRTHGQPHEACLLGEMYFARRYVAVEPMVVNARMSVVLRGLGSDT